MGTEAVVGNSGSSNVSRQDIFAGQRLRPSDDGLLWVCGPAYASRSGDPLTPSVPIFWEGRFGIYGHPILGSEFAGVVLLLTLLKRSVSPSRGDYVWLALASVLLVLSGGKAAIVSAIVAGIVYFALQRKFARAGMLMIAIVVIGYFVVMFSPLSAYLRDYVDTEGANNLTGRTEIWALAWPMMMEKPLLGHGFMSAKFIGLRTDIGFDPTQWHNSLLEIGYTLGAIGLWVYGALHVVTIKNLVRGYQHSLGERRILCIGCIALYLFILINAMVDSSFCGGTPSPGFMLFLVLLVASESLANPHRKKPKRVIRPCSFTLDQRSMRNVLPFLCALILATGLHAQVPPSFFGMTINHATWNPPTPWPKVGFAGIRLWDTSTSWTEIEPSKGVYDWAQFDAWLALAKAHNVDLIYTFGSVPCWAAEKCVGEWNYGPPKDIRDWDEFVRAVVNRANGTHPILRNME